MGVTGAAAVAGFGSSVGSTLAGGTARAFSGPLATRAAPVPAPYPAPPTASAEAAFTIRLAFLALSTGPVSSLSACSAAI